MKDIRFESALTPIVGILMVGVILGLPTVTYRMGQSDIPTLIYIGNIILEGGTPYKDAWDPKGPGAFFAYAFWIKLLGTSSTALRIFDILWQTFTAVALSRISKRIYSNVATEFIAGALYLIGYFSQDVRNFAQVDALISLPLALGFLYVIRGVQENYLTHWLLAGVFVGVASVFKLPFGLIGLLMVLAAFCSVSLVWRLVFWRLVALGAGFLVMVTLTFAYFYWKNSLHDLYMAQFLYAREYVHSAHARFTLDCAIERSSRLVVYPLYSMALFGLATTADIRTLERKGVVSIAVIWGWLGVALVVLFMHGMFIEYHFFPFIAPLSLLSAKTVFVVTQIRLTVRRPMRVVGLAFLGLSLVVPVLKYREKIVNALQVVRRGSDESRWKALGDYLKNHTHQGEKIFVWGNVAELYLHAGRKASTRFIGIWPFAHTVKDVGYRRIFLNEFSADLPRYFVLHKVAEAMPWNVHKGCLLPVNPRSFEEFVPLRKMVAESYDRFLESQEWTLFRLKEPHFTVDPKGTEF